MLALLLLPAAAAAQAPASNTRPPAIRPSAPNEVSAIAAAALLEQQAPGASLVVMKRGKIILARGYGLETVERADSVTPTTAFLLNSMSKQFTAALILKLAEEGNLALDDPVARHLPDFTHLPTGLKIRHLLTHTSGMREIVAQPELNAVFENPRSTDEEFLTLAPHVPLDFVPGSRWSYANMNYAMLIFIAERVSGETLEDALRVRFFRPLGLSSLRGCPPQRGEARGHTRPAGAFVPHPPENFHLFRGVGGYCGNAIDMARWARALVTGRVVSKASSAKMIAPAPLNDGRTADYGMATSLESPDHIRRLGHGGYGGGFSSQFAYYPNAEVTVVVLVNRWVFPEYMERRISRRLLGVSDATVLEVALSAQQRQRYAGSFDLGIVGSYAKVVEREGKLEGEPYGYRLYFGPDGPARKVRMLAIGPMNWYGVRQQRCAGSKRRNNRIQPAGHVSLRL